MGRYLQVSVFARGWPPNSTATENIQEPRSLIMWNIHTFLSPTRFPPMMTLSCDSHCKLYQPVSLHFHLLKSHAVDQKRYFL